MAEESSDGVEWGEKNQKSHLTPSQHCLNLLHLSSQVESDMRRRSELFITAAEGMLGIEFKMQKRIK